MSWLHGCVGRIAVPLLVTLLATAACAPRATASPTPVPVKTDRVAIVETEPSEQWGYAPAVIEIAVGAMASWHNGGTQFHTVTSDSPGRPFDLGLDPGKDATFTFAQAGTFAYHCGVHPQMKGTVVVR
jgi:plastocyanin